VKMPTTNGTNNRRILSWMNLLAGLPLRISKNTLAPETMKIIGIIQLSKKFSRFSIVEYVMEFFNVIKTKAVVKEDRGYRQDAQPVDIVATGGWDFFVQGLLSFKASMLG
jgi:hypothetical protein